MCSLFLSLVVAASLAVLVCLVICVQEALAAVKSVMLDGAFGSAGDEVVIEQLLIGEEVSCMAFADGQKLSLHCKIHAPQYK